MCGVSAEQFSWVAGSATAGLTAMSLTLAWHATERAYREAGIRTTANGLPSSTARPVHAKAATAATPAHPLAAAPFAATASPAGNTLVAARATTDETTAEAATPGATAITPVAVRHWRRRAEGWIRVGLGFGLATALLAVVGLYAVADTPTTDPVPTSLSRDGS